ncbi:hypothetical protein ACLOJK_021707, partial [Asimina triloba]
KLELSVPAVSVRLVEKRGGIRDTPDQISKDLLDPLLPPEAGGGCLGGVRMLEIRARGMRTLEAALASSSVDLRFMKSASAVGG